MQHTERVYPLYMLDTQPAAIPDLVAFWRFDQGGSRFQAVSGKPYVLHSRSGALPVVEDEGAPFSQRALHLKGGSWLNCPRSECPELDIHGPGGQVTVIAWIRRERKEGNECEFIAGQWNETNRGRQYGLFLNISVWQQRHQVCGHLSNVGGPTPGYKYCIDGPVGSTPVPWEEWVAVAMSYDGVQGYAWLDGVLDFRPGLNPYSLAGGLHDGGANGSDFTVGAVDRGGQIGNFFEGHIAGLAIYDRALTPAEIQVLSLKPLGRA